MSGYEAYRTNFHGFYLLSFWIEWKLNLEHINFEWMLLNWTFSIKMETNSIDLIHVESTYKLSLVYKCIRWRKNMSCNSKQIVIVMVCQCWISSNGVCDVEGTDTHVRLRTFSYNWKKTAIKHHEQQGICI